MSNVAERPHAVGADADACLIDPNDPLANDPLLKGEINDEWFKLAHARICREFARQIIQQEKMHMTSNNLTRLGNIRGLDSLDRELDRIARRQSVLGARASIKKIGDANDAYDAIERSLSPDLNAAAAQRDLQKARSE